MFWSQRKRVVIESGVVSSGKEGHLFLRMGKDDQVLGYILMQGATWDRGKVRGRHFCHCNFDSTFRKVPVIYCCLTSHPKKKTQWLTTNPYFSSSSCSQLVVPWDHYEGWVSSLFLSKCCISSYASS